VNPWWKKPGLISVNPVNDINFAFRALKLYLVLEVVVKKKLFYI